MIYFFDIDGVVCTWEKDGEYQNALPYPDRIAYINKLARKHDIIFFTSRGTLTGKDWREVTEKQFKEWKLKYDDIIFQKPYYDVYIDDKAIDDKTFFQNEQ